MFYYSSGSLANDIVGMTLSTNKGNQKTVGVNGYSKSAYEGYSTKKLVPTKLTGGSTISSGSNAAECYTWNNKQWVGTAP